MKNKLQRRVERIKRTWTYQNIQLVIILGLITGIGLQSIGMVPILPKSEVLNYTQHVVKKDLERCEQSDQKCILNEWAENRARELYKQNEDYDLEKYRQQAIIEQKDMLISILDESSFVDYEALHEQYGY